MKRRNTRMCSTMSGTTFSSVRNWDLHVEKEHQDVQCCVKGNGV